MIDLRATLEERLKRDEDAIVKLVQDMTRIPSENPPGDTTELFAFVGGYLEERGLDYRAIAPQAHLPNLLASFDGGEPGRHLILNGHLDVFPAGDAALWSADPFSGQLADGKLFGRGVSDMKTGTAASILTYRYLSEMAGHLKGKLTLTAVSDEETGGVWGTGYLIENEPEVLGDCVLNGEPSTPRTVRFGEKGPLWFTLQVATAGGHGAYAQLSRSAIVETAEIITELQALTETPVPTPAEVLEKIEAAREAFDAALGPGSTDVVTRVTLNVGVIGGGVKVNVIAADCRTEIDLRCPIGVSPTTLLARVDDVLARHPNATTSYTIQQQTEPTWLAPDHEMVGIIQRNAEAARGIGPLPAIGIGGTDCRYWRARGIPAFVYGPTPYNMGAADEYVTLDDLLATVRVHVLSAFDYLMASPPPQ